MFKKLSTFTLILLTLLALIACNPTIVEEEPQTAAEAVALAKNALAITYQGNDNDTSVTQDLLLPTSLTYDAGTVTISWNSSSSALVINGGSAFVQTVTVDTQVTLTATLSLGDAVDTKQFQVTVKATVNPNDAAFNAIFNQFSIPTQTNQDIELPRQVTGYNASINWISSNAMAITNQGKVLPQDEDTTVNLTVIVRYNNETRNRVYTVTVPAVETRIFSLDAYKSDYGYASLIIENRQNQVSNVTEVSNEIEFLEAIADPATTIIKITKDLNLGYYHLTRVLQDAGKTPVEIAEMLDNNKYFRMNPNVPTLHPRLLENGIGQWILQDRKKLMVYSEYGATISHLTISIKTSTDIVFRNLHMTGIWEWDDDLAGNYDELDWDYFTVETTQGLWLDHLKLDHSYDGLVDVKGFTSNFTFSYLDFDFQPTDFIREQIEWLEENYYGVKSPAESRYVRLREFLTPEQIILYASTNKKGFNLGNTTMGLGFDTITVTIHHSYFNNLQDRLPRLRQGDVHMYNVLYDHTQLAQYKGMVSGTGSSVTSQAIVPTEEGAVLMENSKFINVAEPIKTHQDAINDPAYTGRFMVRNSILINGVQYYKGDSYEGQPGGDKLTPWTQSNTNMPRIEFYLRNYQTIPYRYNDGSDYDFTVEPEQLGRVLKDNYVGPGEIPGLNWLEIRPIYSAPINPNAVRGHMIDKKSITITEDLIPVNGQFVPQNPQVRNFYKGGTSYIRNVDYTLDVDTSELDVTQSGTYEVTYIFTNLHDENDVVVIKQSVLVYDPELANEIYRSSTSREFDGTINISYNVYRDSGTLYFAFSNLNNLTREEVASLAELQQIEITSVNGNLEKVPTGRMKYLYMYTIREDLVSELVKIEIQNEVVVPIRNVFDFNAMVTAFDSTGKYYVLENDIDLSEGRLDLLATSNVFSGVFDGQGHKLYNLEKTVLRGGLFMTVNGGMIKNLVIEDVHFRVDSLWAPSSDDPNVLVETKPSDDAGVLATYVYGSAWFSNITIRNSSVETRNNYAAILLGRIRTGYVYYDNITVEDSYVEAYVTAAKYTGGLIGGIETNTLVYMTDIYVNGLDLSHQASDMIGVIVGRVRSVLEVDRVVLLNVTVLGRHNLGITAGKEDNTTTKILATNVFADVLFTLQPDGVGEYSKFHGYIIGNPDAGKTSVSNYYVLAQTDPRWTPSSGLNNVTEILTRDFVVDEAWWETHLPAIYTSNDWVIGEDGLAKLA